MDTREIKITGKKRAGELGDFFALWSTDDSGARNGDKTKMVLEMVFREVFAWSQIFERAHLQ